MHKEVSLGVLNIEAGGFDGYSLEIPTAPRLAKVVELIFQMGHPKVMVAVDTFGWPEHFEEAQIATMFHYRNVRNVRLEDERLKQLGHDNGIAIMTEYPLIFCEGVYIATRNCLVAIMDTDIGPLRVIGLYLDDINEQTRVEQVNALFQYLGTQSRVPTVIVGDLNVTNKRISPEMRAKIQTLLGIETLRKVWHLYTERKDSRVLEMCESRGYVNADPTQQPTFPTHKILPFPVLRVDHILHSSELVASDTHVYDSGLAHEASDHLGVITRIAMKKTS